VHKGAQEVSRWLSERGFSASVTAPLDDLASGNPIAFAKDGFAELRYLHDTGNTAKEMQSVLAKALADPTVGPPLRKYLGDVLGGASADVIAADARIVTSGIRSQAPVLPFQAHMDQVMHIIDSVKQGQLTIGDTANLFSGNPTTAPYAGFLTKLVAFGTNLKGVADPIIVAAAPAAVAAAPVIATLLPAAAPAALATGAVAATVLAANTVTIPDGHQATITKIPNPAAAL
jgi:hypothetical protein